MEHLTQRLVMPIDVRCGGCPALMAHELGQSALVQSACSNSFIPTIKDDQEMGCRIGPPRQDLIIVHSNKRV